jgi:hypothetical protein
MEWYENYEHEQLTSEEGRQMLSKYGSEEEALVGGINAMKKIGAPFRLPEALDKLPDDNVRNELKSSIEKLYGPLPNRIGSADDLKDINFAENLADARDVNETVVEAFKQFAVDEKLDKSVIQKVIGFSNKLNQKLKNDLIEARKKEIDEKTKTTKAKLVELFGSEKAIDEGMERVRRLFQNHMGLTAEEYEQAPKSFMERFITDPVLAKGFLNLAKDVVPEGTTEAGTPGGPAKEMSLAEKQNTQFPIITGYLWPKKSA